MGGNHGVIIVNNQYPRPTYGLIHPVVEVGCGRPTKKPSAMTGSKKSPVQTSLTSRYVKTPRSSRDEEDPKNHDETSSISATDIPDLETVTAAVKKNIRGESLQYHLIPLKASAFVGRTGRKCIESSTCSVFLRPNNASVGRCVGTNLPLSFAHKRGFQELVRIFVEIGQASSPASSIDIKSLILGGNAVRVGVMKVLHKRNEDLKADFKEMLGLGGCISCDGVK